MNRRQLLSRLLPLGSAIDFWLVEASADAAAPYPFSAAYFVSATGGDPHQLYLFPLTGKARRAALPPLPFNFALLAYSPDGRSLYGRNLTLGSSTSLLGLISKGLIKIEFNPPRMSVVPGSTDLGVQWIVISPKLDRLFVYGSHISHGNEYGIFELDPHTGFCKALLLIPEADSGSLPERSQKPLPLVNPADGTIQIIGSEFRIGVWSPDGKWIATVLDKDGHQKMVLIDPRDTSRRRILGSTVDSNLQWSPDSKYLLLSRPELLCGPFSYFESLQALDVATGKKLPISSSHCHVITNTCGWLANDIAAT
jgi:hypothetical protein